MTIDALLAGGSAAQYPAASKQELANHTPT
jgi:hypothetical protein